MGHPAPFGFLDKEGKHLSPHKSFHKLAAGPGGDGSAEGLLLKSSLATPIPLEVRGIMADGFDEELHEAAGDVSVHLLGCLYVVVAVVRL